MLIIIFDEMHARISKCLLQEFNLVIDINSQKSNFKNHQVTVSIKNNKKHRYKQHRNIFDALDCMY